MNDFGIADLELGSDFIYEWSESRFIPMRVTKRTERQVKAVAIDPAERWFREKTLSREHEQKIFKDMASAISHRRWVLKSKIADIEGRIAALDAMETK